MTNLTAAQIELLHRAGLELADNVEFVFDTTPAPKNARAGLHIEYQEVTASLTFASRFSDEGPEYDAVFEDKSDWVDLEELRDLLEELDNEATATVAFTEDALIEYIAEDEVAAAEQAIEDNGDRWGVRG